MAPPLGVFRQVSSVSVGTFPFDLKLTEYPFIREFIDKQLSIGNQVKLSKNQPRYAYVYEPAENDEK